MKFGLWWIESGIGDHVSEISVFYVCLHKVLFAHLCKVLLGNSVAYSGIELCK